MKLLIAEDNEKLAKSLQKGLQQEGFAVDCLFDGEIAERRITSHAADYDAVILDVMMPGKSGLEVCKNIRQQNITLPVLMLTAKDTTKDKIIGLDAGADDYLIKPFDFEELLARVRALLRRPKEALPLVLSTNGIILNSTTRQVTVMGRALTLTLREFAVLEYFMRNLNQVLTREQILAHVWDFSYNSFSNVVDVHIKNLRKKLGATYGRHLETVRGLGYRFKV
jgi:DNA-binding response OmpR family regulator